MATTKCNDNDHTDSRLVVNKDAGALNVDLPLQIFGIDTTIPATYTVRDLWARKARVPVRQCARLRACVCVSMRLCLCLRVCGWLGRVAVVVVAVYIALRLRPKSWAHSTLACLL